MLDQDLEIYVDPITKERIVILSTWCYTFSFGNKMGKTDKIKLCVSGYSESEARYKAGDKFRELYHTLKNKC